jgi:hypothetical protein
MGCINRDKNTVLNMERIVSELIKSGKRLPILSREHNRHYPSGTTMSTKGTNRELKSKSTIKLSRSIKKVNTNQKEKTGIETNKINLLNSKSNKSKI